MISPILKHPLERNYGRREEELFSGG